MISVVFVSVRFRQPCMVVVEVVEKKDDEKVTNLGVVNFGGRYWWAVG